MKKKLFSDIELRHLPVNCALYPVFQNNPGTDTPSAYEKTFNSSYHQNNSMERLGGFYKSVTRMLNSNIEPCEF